LFNTIYLICLISHHKKTSPWFYYAKPSLSDSQRDRLELKFKAGRGLSNGSISPLQIYQAIRNRGYTNVRPWRSRRVGRLRKLKEFETHGGGFCLYSQASAVLGVSPMSNWRANSIRQGRRVLKK
jgi:hypothetical protein